MKKVLYDMLMNKIRAKAAVRANFEDVNYNPADDEEELTEGCEALIECAYDDGFTDGEIAFARELLKLIEG